ncbi:C-type lectin domain family 2 member D-like isoform X2 [Trachemys scripta elegans]|uniref:C-type lectin domain family 2 member D-like isoform X2 n=1 Tax=Trachemys scripta elegans TaxID=31138 RepID=UPI00155823F4|nr:C-type lectin domain family 2 member D-like isoform X2 [Trachemys scripta elegans]
MDPESQRAAASEIELLRVQHAPQGLQERGETEERFNCSGGPGSNHTLRKWASRQVPIPAVVLAAVTVIMLITIITIAALAELLRVEKSKPPVAAPGPPAGPCCPDGWIGYRGKCYYFSETDGNWTYSQSQCSALNASLAAIDSEQEKDFLLRYKGFLDRWIGLQRKPGQPWRWPNGTEFDNRFPIRGGGDCAFLIDENWFGSSRCSTWRRWICSKSDPYTMGKKRAVELKL